eukprot:351929-Chlamydomonas_euryale.AAC.8
MQQSVDTQLPQTIQRRRMPWMTPMCLRLSSLTVQYTSSCHTSVWLAIPPPLFCLAAVSPPLSNDLGTTHHLCCGAAPLPGQQPVSGDLLSSVLDDAISAWSVLWCGGRGGRAGEWQGLDDAVMPLEMFCVMPTLCS